MKLNKLLGFIALPFLAVTLVAQEVEEVVITGSYIKSSPTDGASPVEIIGRDEIDNLNATTIADITANIAVNSGSENNSCLLYTSPSPRDKRQSRMPSSA